VTEEVVGSLTFVKWKKVEPREASKEEEVGEVSKKLSVQIFCVADGWRCGVRREMTLKIIK